MSLLHQEEMDDAARGEELTKGTSHVVIAAVVAAIVVTAAIAIYVIAGQKPPAATGEVIAVWAHPQHTQTPEVDASGAPMPSENFEQIMVFVQVRLHNQSKNPLFLTNIGTNTEVDDGTHLSYAANPGNYDRVFVAYPDLPVPHGKALPLEAELGPGQSVEGTFVSSFRMTKQQWEARKDLSFIFYFRYQPNLVIRAKGPITEQ
jgi:hypothetical protein